MLDRIELDPRVCNGSPVIRGTRIPVEVIMDHLAAGESVEAVLRGFPELAPEDLRAALVFASRQSDKRA
jgi:uncharacterized protein (DUF433 family)